MSNRAYTILAAVVIISSLLAAASYGQNEPNKPNEPNHFSAAALGPVPDQVLGVIRSTDNRHIVIVAAKGTNKMQAFIDGRAELEYDEIGQGSIIFSPDGNHLAYSAKNNGKWFVVADGKAGPEYDTIGKDTIIFSPDSKRLAYAASKGIYWMVVTDGRVGQQ